MALDVRIRNQMDKFGAEAKEMLLTGTMVCSIIYLLFKVGSNFVAWGVIGIFAVVLIWEAQSSISGK